MLFFRLNAMTQHNIAPSLAAYLAEIIAVFPSDSAFAAAIDMDTGRLCRVLNGTEKSLAVDSCLRIARVTRTSPYPLLRAAGKGATATLMYDLVGEMADPDEIDLLAAFRRCSPAMRAELLRLFVNVSQSYPETQAPRSRRRKSIAV